MIIPVGGRDTNRQKQYNLFISKHRPLKEGAGFHSKPDKRVEEEVMGAGEVEEMGGRQRWTD